MGKTGSILPLAAKLVLGLSAIVAAAILSLGLYLTAVVERSAGDLINRDLQDAVISDRDRLNAHISALWDNLSMIVKRAPAGQEALQQFILEAARHNRDFALLGVAKVDGAVLASSRDHWQANLANIRWFGQALSAPVVSADAQILQLLTAAADGGKAIVLASPVRNPDGLTVAVIFALADPDRLIALLRNSAGLARKSVLLANDGGEVLRWQHSRFNSSQSDRGGEHDGSLDRRDVFAATAHEASAAAFPATGWTLTSQISKAEALANLQPLLHRIWAACFAGACSILIGAALWAAWLSAPLRDIVEFAERIAAGTPVAPPSSRRHREAASLTDFSRNFGRGCKNRRNP